MAILKRATMPSPQRMVEIEGYVEDIARVEGVPASIVKGVIWQESKFDELSHRFNQEKVADRSYGLMHLAVPTAREVSGNAKLQASDLYEPMYNIWIGCRYLSNLYKKYKDWSKAVSAYNYGHVEYVAAGIFANQNYVNIVLRVANILKTSVIKAFKL